MATDNTFYIDTSLFSTATAVWTDTALTAKAADGWYQAPVEGVITYRQQTSGTLGVATSCVCLTSWPSSAGTNFGSACSITIDQTYYHDGAGVFPAVADHCYSDINGDSPLAAGSFPHYRFSNTVPITPVDTFLIITGSAGEVDSVTACP